MQQAAEFQIRDGQLLGARQIPSPNFNQRPEHTDIQLLVIHNISLPPSQFGGGYIEQFFRTSWTGQCIRIFRLLKACRYLHIC